MVGIKSALSSMISKTPFNTFISNETVKDDWKTAISVAKQQEISMPTIAKEVVNQNLIHHIDICL